MKPRLSLPVFIGKYIVGPLVLILAALIVVAAIVAVARLIVGMLSGSL